MNIEPFEKFLNTLTPEIIEQITEKAGLRAEEVRNDPEADAKTFVGNQIAAISLTYSIELLSLYHKWLEQQL